MCKRLWRKKSWFDALWWFREGFGRLGRFCVLAGFAPVRRSLGEGGSKAPTNDSCVESSAQARPLGGSCYEVKKLEFPLTNKTAFSLEAIEIKLCNHPNYDSPDSKRSENPFRIYLYSDAIRWQQT
ncbi:Unannotated [Lentimonas sp. CC4]|nr:Unannotated [Lentimonas sp. CC4]CAA6686597.1 Unannotated [Lentimonas sp. CC6]CAA7074873.1 Unannotated [Lentimonas sp. CC4]CAA7169499.1 Unannotated [Lentimonas sp. CC21]CAA7179771.1 Unannotated [Lentimonas sp. CC8]